METRKSTVNKQISFCILLFLLCIIPEMIYITRHGFYWDDWSQLLLHEKFGDASFWEYFSYNRPLSAWTTILYFPVCGSSPIKWHILLLVLKWFLCILFYKIIKFLFPNSCNLSKTAAVLFAVCPLFSQTYISIAYTQHYTDFVLFALSLLLLLYAYDSRSERMKILLYFISIVCTILHLTVTEYFAFIELMKVPVFCFIMRNRNPETEKQKIFFTTLKYCSAHLIIFILYCLYRLNITDFFPNAGTETPDLLYLFLKSPAAGISALIRNMTVDILFPFTGFISTLLDFNLQTLLTKSELLVIAVSIIISLISGLYLSKQEEEKNTQGRNILWTAVFCIMGILLGILPFLVMNENCLNTDDLYHADRTFLAAMPFVCLFFSNLLRFFLPDIKLHTIGVCTIVFLFCHRQMIVYNEAEIMNEEQNSFYQQLAVRIPDFEEGTAIVDDTIIFPEQGNFATASAVNVLYSKPITENGHVPVWIFSYRDRPFEEHGTFHVQNRNYHFDQLPTEYIYIDHDNKYANCTWVFRPEDADNPHITDLQRGWIKNTKLSRIRTDAAFIPDAAIFGKADENWCHYYQKASLLLQQEDWQAVSELTDIVLYYGYSPSDKRSNSPFEWWPFIEGLLRTGRIGKA